MRTRRSESSSDPVPSLDNARDTSKHRSVLLHEAIDSLDIRSDDTVVDATLGGAGHAREIAKRLGGGTLIGFDLDHDAIARALRSLSDVAPAIVLVNANFRSMREELAKRGVEHIDKALFDLGWSSDQLDAGRGFSFLADEPLLMTYGSAPGGLTARVIVNTWAEESLADIIFGWGQERNARRIAKAIVEAREKKPIATSRELADIIARAISRNSRTHPATKTFQALRIAVNDELGALKEGLQTAWELLSEGGRIAVITFHSIEDGQVKRTFAAIERSGAGKRLSKKPIAPGREEIASNPRSRSAKLRVLEKISPTI